MPSHSEGALRDVEYILQKHLGGRKVTGINMFAKIKELKALGYKKLRAANELNIDVKTVRKYWDMDEIAYAGYLKSTKTRAKIMEPYRNSIVVMITAHADITSAVIYDHLKESDRSFKPSYRSVRLYVSNLRETLGIPTPKKIRQYTECDEHPLGFQAQVDLGQTTIKDVYGEKVKIYIFAMVMSASRQKYTFFQLKPFTAQTFVEAHDKAFSYFGGRTTEIVYDQDRVMVVSENLGDIIFTETFESYKNYAGFSVHLCRGYDPESKGKIEAVIKYVKYNFLKYRLYHGISTLNSQGLAWLDRTGNGMIHETTKMIPKIVFEQERKHLKAVATLSINTIVPKEAIVRKTNVVFYRQNRYAVPKGTYYPGRKVRIQADESTDTVSFFDIDTNKLIEKHMYCHEKGKYIRNSHPERDRFSRHEKLKTKVMDEFEDTDTAKTFVENMLSQKKRYSRDQLGMISNLQASYSKDKISQALNYCIKRSLFSAVYLKDALEYFNIEKADISDSKVQIPAKYSRITIETRAIEAYLTLTSKEALFDE